MVRFLEIQGPNCREVLHRPLPKATHVCWKKKNRRRRRTCTREVEDPLTGLSYFHYRNDTEPADEPVDPASEQNYMGPPGQFLTSTRLRVVTFFLIDKRVHVLSPDQCHSNWSRWCWFITNYGRVSFCWNARAYLAESSLQSILSNLFLWKLTNCSVVILNVILTRQTCGHGAGSKRRALAFQFSLCGFGNLPVLLVFGAPMHFFPLKEVSLLNTFIFLLYFHSTSVCVLFVIVV